MEDLKLTAEKLNKMLGQQLQLLAERSKKCESVEDLVALSAEMREWVRIFWN